MTIDKTWVLAEARKMNITLTDEQAQELVEKKRVKLSDEQLVEIADDKLRTERSHKSIDDIRRELEALDRTALIDRIVEEVSKTREARTEAKERRIAFAELKRQADELTTEVQTLTGLKEQNPRLAEKIANLEGAEKRRREAILAKLPEEKRNKLNHLVNVDKTTADEFDATIEVAGGTGKGDGSNAPPPSSRKQIVLTDAQKAEAARMNLTEENYIAVQRKRGKIPAESAEPAPAA